MPSVAGPDDRKHFNFNAQKMSWVTKKKHYFWNLIDAKTIFSILKHVANRVSRSPAQIALMGVLRLRLEL